MYPVCSDDHGYFRREGARVFSSSVSFPLFVVTAQRARWALALSTLSMLQLPWHQARGASPSGATGTGPRLVRGPWPNRIRTCPRPARSLARTAASSRLSWRAVTWHHHIHTMSHLVRVPAGCSYEKRGAETERVRGRGSSLERGHGGRACRLGRAPARSRAPAVPGRIGRRPRPVP